MSEAAFVYITVHVSVFSNILLPFFNDVDTILICNARPSTIHEILNGRIRKNTQQRVGTPLVNE
jgi:hypothetical protein